MFYRAMRIIFWLAFWSALAAAAFYGWQKNIFLLNSFLLGALALLLLYFLQKSAFVKKYYNESFGNTLLGLAGLIFFTTSLGTVYFYKYIKFFEYDFLAHMIIPAAFVVMAAMFYAILKIKKGVPGKVGVILISGLLVLLLSFFWEFFQKQGDIWWGTQMFFDSNQPIAIDVANDLGADVFGVFAGCVLIFKNWEKWNKKWLKTTDDKRLTTNNS
jgi:hypothetical protein